MLPFFMYLYVLHLTFFGYDESRRGPEVSGHMCTDRSVVWGWDNIWDDSLHLCHWSG